MKQLLLLLVFLSVTLSIQAQKTNSKYDAELAKKVGADDYGMKSYIFVILKTGTNTSTNKIEVDKAFAGHMTNMNTMVEAGKLVVAGLLAQMIKTIVVFFILNESDMEKAKILLATDPAIKAKFLDYDIFPWYGSAALSEYLEASDKVWKVGF